MENQTRSPEEIEVSTEKLLADLRAVVQDGEDLLRAGAKNLSEQGVAARERLAAALEVARETRVLLEARAREGMRTADQAIREHPYRSIGVAFGIGMVLGLILNRK